MVDLSSSKTWWEWSDIASQYSPCSNYVSSQVLIPSTEQGSLERDIVSEHMIHEFCTRRFGSAENVLNCRNSLTYMFVEHWPNLRAKSFLLVGQLIRHHKWLENVATWFWPVVSFDTSFDELQVVKRLITVTRIIFSIVHSWQMIQVT